MTNAGRRQPAVNKPLHPVPVNPASLATPRQRAVPVPTHLKPKQVKRLTFLVRENDRIEFAWIAWGHMGKRAHERTRAGIDVNLRRAESQPHAARRAKLARNHKSRATTPKKENRIQSYASLRSIGGGSCLLAYRSKN